MTEPQAAAALVSTVSRLRSLLNLGIRGSRTVSPTAHYTGYVWARHGIGPAELATPEGAALYHLALPLLRPVELLGGPSLEGFLLARHRIIDHLLTAAIESGEVGSVVEIAAGMSPRGYSFANRYGASLTYVETDLPQMAAVKHRILAGLGSLSDSHRVAELDALADDGPGSLAALGACLDPTRGLAVVTEGLLNYLPAEAVRGLWRRVAASTSRFPTVRYLSDLHVQAANRGAAASAFTVALSAFVRTPVHLHFSDENAALAGLRAAGFADATLHHPRELAATIPDVHRRGADNVRIVEAVARA